MLIAIDVGNSHVRLGGYEEDAQVFAASIAADPKQTGDFYACALRQLFALYGVQEKQVSAAILGSVVPSMTAALVHAMRVLGVDEVLEVSSGLKTGLNLRTEQPRQIGADRVAAAVAAKARGQLPCVVVDCGTATAFTVLDGTGALVGSAITAGVRLSLDALRQRAAQLPAVALETPAPCDVIARNTADAMRVGTVLGAAAMVDGMVLRYGEALGEMPHVLITGGSAPLILPYVRTAYTHDENLCLDGLHLIWKRNRG